MNEDRVDTVVIGGGQAGLAVGYHLRRQRVPFVILDQNHRIGDAWRNRWDSLRLFTPARYSELPGLRLPGPPSAYPTKDEMADYLEAYARQFALPVRTGVRVDRLSAGGHRFEARCSEEVLTADHVVVATGAYHHPRIPAFAAGLNGDILQCHASGYRNHFQLRKGGVLVVGAGNSGAEIAVELARHHQTWLSGPDTGQEPTRAGSLPDRLFTPIVWLIATRLTVKTMLGRKLRDHFLDPPRGIPLGRVYRNKSPMKVQTGNGFDDASVLDGKSVAGRHREIDPAEVRRVSGAPDHVRHLQHPAVFEERVTVPHARGPSDPLDARGGYLLSAHTRSARRSWAVWGGTPNISSVTSPRRHRLSAREPQ